MQYLIDTQVCIWSLINPLKIRPSVRTILTENSIWVSQISLFEIAIKQKIGRLPEFMVPIGELVNRLEEDSFQLLPLQNTHIAAYHTIPLLADHRDPFDRLILASALAENLTVISADEQFRLYVPQIQLIEA